VWAQSAFISWKELLFNDREQWHRWKSKEAKFRDTKTAKLNDDAAMESEAAGKKSD
jgi:hypothetical protein